MLKLLTNEIEIWLFSKEASSQNKKFGVFYADFYPIFYAKQFIDPPFHQSEASASSKINYCLASNSSRGRQMSFE
jgi:hypothetical protein